MNEWISVKEKPMPIDIPILIYAKYESLSEEYITSVVIDKYGYLYGHGFGGYEWEFEFRKEEITHWMPLPEPPNNLNKN